MTMNNGIITYDKQVFFKLLNDSIKKLKGNPISVPILTNTVPFDLSLDYEEEIFNSKSENITLRELKNQYKRTKEYTIYEPDLRIEDFSYANNLLDKEKILYKNFKKIDNLKGRTDLEFSNFIRNNDVKDLNSISKKIKTLSDAINITRNISSYNSGELNFTMEKIRLVIENIVKNDKDAIVKTDIAARYDILFYTLKKSIKIKKDVYLDHTGSTICNDLFSLKEILGKISNINSKNSSQYIKNFITAINESKEYIVSNSLFEMFKKLNSKRMCREYDDLMQLNELVFFYDNNQLKQRNIFFKRIIKIVNRFYSEGKIRVDRLLEDKSDLFKNIENIRSFCKEYVPPGYEEKIPFTKNKNFLIYVFKSYRLLYNPQSHIIYIVDGSNIELILKSLERISNLMLYYSTNALNSDEKVQYPTHIKNKECIKKYINLLLNRYDLFLENKYDLNKLPRYFFDLSDLLIACIANTTDTSKQFDKVNKIIDLFKEKSYAFGDELEIAKDFISSFGFNISYNISKAFKILTTPDYNYLSALVDLENTFSKDSGYDTEVFKEFDALQIREFAKNFYKTYNFLPNLTYNESLIKAGKKEKEIQKLYSNVGLNPKEIEEQEDCYINERRNWDAKIMLQKTLDNWYGVQYEKNFPYLNYSSFFELEAKDKRRILLKNTFYKDFLNKAKEKMKDRSEIINMILSEDNSSIENFKEDLLNNKLPKEIPIVLAYKDEIHKPNSRLFFMAPTEFRFICSELEYNLEKVLNLKNGNSMTSGAKIINDKLEKVASVTGIDKKYLKLIISFDLKKLSTRFPRFIIKREFEKLSKLFGSELINKIYECIEKTVVYHVSNNFYYSFKPTHGCYEGFLNKFWTSYHIDVMTYTVYKLRKEDTLLNTLHYSLNVFSDDGVLCCYQDSDGKLLEEAEIFNYNKKIYSSVKSSYQRLGLILSEDKTFVSDRFATFLNKIFLDGTQINNDLKSFMRISDYQCNKVLTLNDKVRNLYSTVQGSLVNGTGIFHGYITFYFKVISLLNKNYPTFYSKSNDKKIIFLLCPKELGGLGLGSIYKLCSSLEYDDLSMSINSLLHVSFYKKNKTQNFYINNILNQKLKIHLDMTPGTCIFNSNFSHITYSDDFLDRLNRKCLFNKVKNNFIKSLNDNEAIRDFNEIYSLLYNTPYMDVVLFETILSLTPVAYFNTIYKGLEKIDTIKYFIRYKSCKRLQSYVYKLDNSAIEKFMKTLTTVRTFSTLFVNDYKSRGCVIDVNKINSNEDAYKIALFLRKKYIAKNDITHSTEVCCSNGIYYNSKLQKELFTAIIQDYENKHNIIDKYLGYDEDSSDIPIFSYISKTNLLNSYDYINSYSIINLKSFNMKTKNFQEVENPNFFEFSEVDSIIKRIYILDNLVDHYNIPIRRPLLILHATWGIPFNRSNNIFSFDVSRNFLAHFIIKKSKHTFLGLRASSSLQIINARAISKQQGLKYQNFDIYRYLLTLRIFMSCELEIQSLQNFKITKALPLFTFNLCTQFYDPDDLMMTELTKSDYYKFYNFDEDYYDYYHLIKERKTHSILRKLIFNNDSNLDIWEDLNIKINTFLQSNFNNQQEEYLKQISENFNMDKEDMKFLEKLPDVSIESVVIHDFKYYDNLIKKDKKIKSITYDKEKKESKDNSNKGKESSIVRIDNNNLDRILPPDEDFFGFKDIIESDKFTLRNKFSYLDRLDVNDVLKGIMCYVLHNINLKKLSFEGKSQSMKGRDRRMLSKFGLLISNILYKYGTYQSEEAQKPFLYSDLNQVKKILNDCNFTHYFRRTCKSVLSFNQYLMNNCLSHFEESLMINDSHYVYAQDFIDMIKSLWETRNGKENPQYTWRFFFTEKSTDISYHMNKQLYEYIRFTNALYKIYYKSKMNNLSVEISKLNSMQNLINAEDNIEKYNDITNKLNKVIRLRTLTQLKKSFLNIRSTNILTFNPSENKYVFDKDRYELSFIKQLNLLIKKFCKAKNQDDDTIISIVYINDNYIEFTSERNKDLNFMFSNDYEVNMLNDLFFDFKKFFETDLSMLNANIVKINNSVDIERNTDFIIINYIPDYDAYKNNGVDESVINIEAKVVKQDSKSHSKDLFSYYESYINQSTDIKTKVEAGSILRQTINKVSNLTNTNLSLEDIKIEKTSEFGISIIRKKWDNLSEESSCNHIELNSAIKDKRIIKTEHNKVENKVASLEICAQKVENCINTISQVEKDETNKMPSDVNNNDDNKVNEDKGIELEDLLGEDMEDIMGDNDPHYDGYYIGIKREKPYNPHPRDIYDLMPITLDDGDTFDELKFKDNFNIEKKPVNKTEYYNITSRMVTLENFLYDQKIKIVENIKNRNYLNITRTYRKYAKTSGIKEFNEFYLEELERLCLYIRYVMKSLIPLEEFPYWSKGIFSLQYDNYFDNRIDNISRDAYLLNKTLESEKHTLVFNMPVEIFISYLTTYNKINKPKKVIDIIKALLFEINQDGKQCLTPIYVASFNFKTYEVKLSYPVTSCDNYASFSSYVRSEYDTNLDSIDKNDFYDYYIEYHKRGLDIVKECSSIADKDITKIIFVTEDYYHDLYYRQKELLDNLNMSEIYTLHIRDLEFLKYNYDKKEDIDIKTININGLEGLQLNANFMVSYKQGGHNFFLNYDTEYVNFFPKTYSSGVLSLHIKEILKNVPNFTMMETEEDIDDVDNIIERK